VRSQCHICSHPRIAELNVELLSPDPPSHAELDRKYGVPRSTIGRHALRCLIKVPEAVKEPKTHPRGAQVAPVADPEDLVDRIEASRLFYLELARQALDAPLASQRFIALREARACQAMADKRELDRDRQVALRKARAKPQMTQDDASKMVREGVRLYVDDWTSAERAKVIRECQEAEDRARGAA
jgi:hypothetical protein